MDARTIYSQYAESRNIRVEKFPCIGALLRALPKPLRILPVILSALGVCGLLPLPAYADAPIQLPIEVMGPVGTTANVKVHLPDTVSGAQPYQLWMQIHGLAYPDKMSIRVNAGEWVPLNNQTVDVLGPGAKYGGIGGGFATLKLVRMLPQGLIHPGENTLSLRFDKTAGFSSGFRVLAFNFQTMAGSNLLPASTFVQEDPNTWQPPLNDPADIAMGKQLYQTGALVENSDPGAPKIQAHCGDCHAWDGRDLKYFNYSNNSIVVRSVFHGLTDKQGQQIASYIRSLKVPNPGRPWNPPYQPGPGLDSKPIEDWAAGAGINAVLDKDTDMLPYLFPNGINKEAVATKGNLNVHEIPLAMQFPDWNRWLPKVYPLDAWGNDFFRNNLLTKYNGTGGGNSPWNFRDMLSAGADKYMHQNPTLILSQFGYWGNDRYELITSEIAKLGARGHTTTAGLAQNIYSTAQWQLVKTWELMQEFHLEGYGPTLFGNTYGEPRTWFVDTPFRNSPFQLHIPSDSNGIGGSALTNEYFSNVWYQVQLTLNDSNHQNHDSSPIDWPYVYGKLKDLYRLSHSPEPMRLTLYLVKGMQISDNGIHPDDPHRGWRPDSIADVSRLVHGDWVPMFAEIPSEQRRRMFQAILETWFERTQQSSPDKYYAGGLAKPEYIPNSAPDGKLADKIMYMIPRFRALGVEDRLLTRIVDWAATVWPRGDWNAVRSRTDRVILTRQ